MARPKADLIFMDLHMPGMDGDACCAAIKADPDLKRAGGDGRFHGQR